MPTLRTADFRIEIQYPVQGQIHKFHVWVDSDDTAAPFNLKQRDATTVLFSAAAQGLWDALRKVFDSAVHGSDCVASLQHFESLSWLPVEFATISGSGSSTGTGPIIGVQATMTLRTRAVTRFKVVIGEPKDTLPSHYPGSTPPTAMIALAQEFSHVPTVTNPPWNYVQDMANRYIADSAEVVAITVTLNRKLRRARGLA